MSTRNRFILLVIALILIGGSIYYLDAKKARHSNATGTINLVANSTVHTPDYEQRAQKFPMAPEITDPQGFINTNNQPITFGSLVGKKVILVDFWTYSCINCQRTAPYLNSWYEKYKDQGLEIVGIHTPEFDFEKKLENVQMGVDRLGVKYPVVLDNNYGTWDAYRNQYWPAHYLIDINGLVVDRHIGEGGYEETERKIQQLLQERKQAMGESGDISTTITSINQDIKSGSPETYFGFSRNQLLANGKASAAGEQTLTVPTILESNKLYLGGTWNFASQYATNQKAGAKIVFKYSAKAVYFVGSADSDVSITVMRDGKPVGEFRGEDLDASGKGTVKGSRLYKLIEEKQAGTHTIEIIINNPGLNAFTFTFG